MVLQNWSGLKLTTEIDNVFADDWEEVNFIRRLSIDWISAFCSLFPEVTTAYAMKVTLLVANVSNNNFELKFV